MIIDLQKAYYEGDAKVSMDNACEYINAVLPMFRQANSPILWVQDADEDDGVVPGVPEFDLIEGLEPLENEYRITKKYSNSFNKTRCAEILKEHDVNLVVITGYCAEYCVLATYKGALDYDLTPVILRNGIASFKEKNIGFVEDISEIISYQVLSKLLEKN